MEQGQEPEAGASLTRERALDVLRQPRVTLGVLIGVAVVAVAVVWAVLGTSSSDSDNTSSADPIAPVGLSFNGLQTLAAGVGQPIYWAGPKEGYLYELTRNSEGDVYIRYLPPGVDVGAKEAKYLVIVTYPFANALQSLKNVANAKGIKIPGGGIALVDRHPQSVHLAYPDSDYQIEVYDPSPARSLDVARSGDVRPVVQ